VRCMGSSSKSRSVTTRLPRIRADAAARCSSMIVVVASYRPKRSRGARRCSAASPRARRRSRAPAAVDWDHEIVHESVAMTRTLSALVLSVAAATLASAQTIAPVDYLPLGQGFQWQLTRTAGGGPSDLHLEVTDVNVADSGTRYLLDIPSDVHLGF